LNLNRKPKLILGAMTTLGALGAAAVLAVHNVPQAGPFIANTLRSVIGVNAVARLEETVAAAEDSVMQLRWADKAPRSLSELSPTIVNQSVAPSVTPPLASIDTSLASIRSSEPDVSMPVVAAAAPASPVFVPPVAVKPPFPEVAAPGDGVWIPVPDPEHPEASPVMFKTLIHPDPERRYTELFVVAMPSSQVKLTSVPGTEEPASENPAAVNISNRGMIPKSQRGDLLAAFNGGFRAEHGHHGMMVDGVTLLEPRADMCTVFGYEDGSLQIGTFARINAQPQKPVWYRQTPRCMVEQGNLHPGLRDPDAKGWGATLEGETVIRRSAIALSQDGETLFVAVTNSTTARALALGMRAAGGWNVAQLDVNRSFPKFLLFPRDESGARHAQTLFDGFLFDREEMIDEPNPRDFFYLVRRRLEERTEASPQVEAKNQAG
jgi:hypothetical protein